eukprot:COSAG01_NODE_14948_length_1392_cov_47.034803_1_plen_92_part_00
MKTVGSLHVRAVDVQELAHRHQLRARQVVQQKLVAEELRKVVDHLVGDGGASPLPTSVAPQYFLTRTDVTSVNLSQKGRLKDAADAAPAAP